MALRTFGEGGGSVGFEGGLEVLPNIGGDDFGASGVGVHAVGLVEVGLAADALQKERDEGRVIAFGDAGENGGESGSVVLAHVGRHHHAGNEDARVGVFGADFVNDGLKVGFGDFDVETAQAVIAAEGHDEDGNRLAQQPVEAVQAVGRGVTADSGVHDGPLLVEAGVDEGFFKDGGEGILVVKAEAGGKAVAEDDNALLGGGGAKIRRVGRGGGRRGRSSQGEDGQERNQPQAPMAGRMSKREKAGERLMQESHE